MTTDEPTIKDRADRAEAALAYFFELEQGDPGAAVTDALADLRHFCDRHSLCFGDLDRTAYSHYLAELEEERHGT